MQLCGTYVSCRTYVSRYVSITYPMVVRLELYEHCLSELLKVELNIKSRPWTELIPSTLRIFVNFIKNSPLFNANLMKNKGMRLYKSKMNMKF